LKIIKNEQVMRFQSKEDNSILFVYLKLCKAQFSNIWNSYFLQNIEFALLSL